MRVLICAIVQQIKGMFGRADAEFHRLIGMSSQPVEVSDFAKIVREERLLVFDDEVVHDVGGAAGRRPEVLGECTVEVLLCVFSGQRGLFVETVGELRVCGHQFLEYVSSRGAC